MDRLTLAKELVQTAGEITLSWFDKENFVIQKSDKDFALTADIEAEKIILDGIRKHYPKDEILSEEAGSNSKTSEYKWIIDPLDGSANFKAKIPHFCTPIAIEKNGRVVMSVVYDPIHKDLYCAEKGKGAFLNDESIHISHQNIISQFLISYSTSNHKSKEIIDLGATIFKNALHHCRAVRLQGSSVLDLCNLAKGTFDGLTKVGANYWDYAPGCLIVEEAGGIVTNFDGKAWGADTENIIGSNNCCHEELIESLIYSEN